jgi:hypothetical protein
MDMKRTGQIALAGFYHWQRAGTHQDISCIAEWTARLISNIWKKSWDASTNIETPNPDYHSRAQNLRRHPRQALLPPEDYPPL